MTPAFKALAFFAAHRSLKDRCVRAEIRAILADTARQYDTQEVAIPDEEGFGGRLMVRLAALTIAFYRSLLRRGFSENEARQRCMRGTWAVYEKMAAVPQTLSLHEQDPLKRLGRRVALFRQFPFRPPGYGIVDIDAGDDVVAFDVRRCPVAEYFAACGLQELCIQSFCDLDFPLADKWGATLERTGTLVAGAPCCDFRWRAISDAKEVNHAIKR